jgi:hypothetical protein
MLHLLTDLKLRGSRTTRPRSRDGGEAPVLPEPDRWAQMIARGKARGLMNQEPSLDEVLDDPVIRRMMQRDRVEPEDIRRFVVKKRVDR